MNRLKNTLSTAKVNLGDVITTVKNSAKVQKVLVVCTGIILSVNQRILARPSTGYDTMDNGAWQLVTIFQAAIFWVTLLYTLKALFMFSVKGEGDWKNIITGFLICIADYLVPWVFGMIPGMFKF